MFNCLLLHLQHPYDIRSRETHSKRHTPCESLADISHNESADYRKDSNIKRLSSSLHQDPAALLAALFANVVLPSSAIEYLQSAVHRAKILR